MISRRFVTRLGLLFALFSWALAGLAERAFGQSFVPGDFFFDSFDDGNHQDSDPIYWKRGDFQAEDDKVIDGDLHILGMTGPASSVAPSDAGGPYWSYAEDLSITTQLRILPGDGVASAGVYGRSLDARVYFGAIDENGMMLVGKSDDSGATIATRRHSSGLDPEANDVLLKMDFDGDLMSLSAWTAGDAMPRTPQVTFQDDELTSGTIALLGFGQGEVAFRWVDVTPVPEPGGLLLASIGFIALVGASHKYLSRPVAEVPQMKTRTTLASLVIVMAFLPLAVNTGNCQVVFEDDFSNGNADTPVKWTPRLLPFGEYDATSGDYIFRALPGFDTSGAALASDPADFVLEDTSAVSQVRADGPFDNMGIGARWTEATPSGYFNGITGSGLVIIGRTDGPDGFTILASAETDLDVGSQDVLLRLDAIGTTLKTWAWLPGDEMPDEPLLTVEDTMYQSGTPAIYANPRPDGQAIFRFVNVSVPEPATLPLATFGFLSLLAYRKENLLHLVSG